MGLALSARRARLQRRRQDTMADDAASKTRSASASRPTTTSAIETAAKEIVETADAHRRDRVRARAAADREERLRVIRSPVQGQGLARALRDPHAQAADRHPPADAEDGRLAPAARPPARRRRHRDPARVRLDDGRDPRQEARDDPALPRGRPRRARHRARGRPLPGDRRSARTSATATRPSSSRFGAVQREAPHARPSSATSRRPTPRRCATSWSSATRPAS